jgi:anti-sigma B factor antagonist
MRLQLHNRYVGQVAVIKCDGRIVAGPEAEALDAYINELLLDTRHFVLDLSGVNFIDSTGLGTLVRLLGTTRAVHGDLKLCNVPEAVAHTLRITALHTLLDMHSSEIEAVAAFYKKKAQAADFRSGTAVLCLDGSEDVLACLRELLRRAGYAPTTASNPFDARVLISATRPALVILGPNPIAQAGGPERAFRQALGGVPLLELDSDFCTNEAGEAAQKLLQEVSSRIGKAAVRKQA